MMIPREEFGKMDFFCIFVGGKVCTRASPERKFNNSKHTIMENEIVLYQPSESIKLDVRVEGETVWLTQEQIALLFGTQRPAITKHLNNIYKCGELDEPSTCSILERMGNR